MPEEAPELLSVSADDYGPEYRAHVLEQYKLYVDSACQVSERRTGANNYFLTVNSSLVAVFGLIAGFKGEPRWLNMIPLAGIMVALSWVSLIRSYRNLNTAKFAVIHELEGHLPVALFKYEWFKAEHGKTKAYKPLSHIEPLVPLAFLLLYVGLAAYVWFMPTPKAETETTGTSVLVK